MMLINIKVFREDEAPKISEELNDGSPLVTKDTLETLHNMSVEDFQSLIYELQQTFVALQTAGGKAIMNAIQVT